MFCVWIQLRWCASKATCMCINASRSVGANPSHGEKQQALG
jgi:hypothetical protein